MPYACSIGRSSLTIIKGCFFCYDTDFMLRRSLSCGPLKKRSLDCFILSPLVPPWQIAVTREPSHEAVTQPGHGLFYATFSSRPPALEPQAMRATTRLDPLTR